MNTIKQQELTPLQKRILKEWQKTKVVHPSMRQIAKKIGCSNQTVWKTVEKYAPKE